MNKKEKEPNKYARRFSISKDIEFGYYITSKEELSDDALRYIYIDTGLKRAIDRLIGLKLDEKAAKLINLKNVI